jgi:hypothetical protein
MEVDDNGQTVAGGGTVRTKDPKRQSGAVGQRRFGRVDSSTAVRPPDHELRDWQARKTAATIALGPDSRRSRSGRARSLEQSNQAPYERYAKRGCHHGSNVSVQRVLG